MKDAPGWEGLYAVTKDGRVWSYRKHKFFLNRKVGDVGYYVANLMSKEGKHILIRVHQLVARTYIPNPENYRCVNHKNGIKTDNSVENLEWCTVLQNNRHARKMGLTTNHAGLKGSDNPRAKFTNEQIRKIRQLRKQGITYPELKKRYRVSLATLWYIIENKHYSNVESV